MVGCYRNFKLLCTTLFPDSFTGPMTTLHNSIFDLFESKERFVAIAAPRGIGKTTITRTYVARNILFQDKFFIPYVAKSHDAACLQTENLKRDLTSNPELTKIFGPVKMRDLDNNLFTETFSKKSWVAYKSLVMPRGYGQQIRGLVYNNHRPDLFVIDDLEDDEQIHNPEYRKNLKIWFNATLLKAISAYSTNWRIIYIDTLKHEDSLLQDLLDSERWASCRLELCDDNCKSNVPELYSDEQLKAEHDYHEEQGILDVFYREFRNLPVAGKDAVFQKKYFKYYLPQEIIKKSGIHWVVIVDPAKTAKMHSADSAVIGIGIDTVANAIYIQDIVRGKFFPDQLYEEMFSMAWRINAEVIGVETTGLEEFIKQPIKNEAVKRNCKCELMWLTARGGSNKEKGKDLRIAALAPYYRQGSIYHNAEVCGVLETQLLSFPRSKYKDVMDATAYIVELLDMGDIYFTSAKEDKEDEDLEATYQDLLDESDAPLVGWRRI